MYVTSGFNLSYLIKMSPRFLKLCRIFFLFFFAVNFSIHWQFLP